MVDVKFEPRASTLQAAWELQSWRESTGEAVASFDLSEALPAPQDSAPTASSDSLPQPNLPIPQVESSIIDESDEVISHVHKSAHVGSSNVSSHGSDAHTNTSQCNGSTSVNTSDSSTLSLHMHDTSSAPTTAQPNRPLDDQRPLLAIGTLRQIDSQLPEVQLLEEHQWIRCQAHHGNTSVKIYVDPKLVHRNNTQRSIKDLRIAFRIVMSKIDPSLEAWEARRDPKITDAMSNGEDDESLWYIFNTLQDPNPQVDSVKDAPSRKAMSYLLSDEDFSEYGLKTPLYPYQRRSAAMMIQREVQPARMLDPRLQACSSPGGPEYYYDKEDGWITLQKDMYDEAVGGKYLSCSLSDHS